MKNIIPQSFLDLCASTALQEAVQSLIERADGGKSVSRSFEDARTYDHALKMALVARSEHNQMLFDLWDATWKTAGAMEIGQSFEGDFERLSPAMLWQDGELRRHRGFELQGVALIDFYVQSSYEGIWLEAAFNDDDYAWMDWDAVLGEEPEGWKSYIHEDARLLKTVKIQDEASISTLEGCAERFVRAVEAVR